MNKKITFGKMMLAVMMLIVTSSAKAQLTTSNLLTPTQLVQNILVGTGITVSGVVFNGDPNAIGDFNGAASNIGFTTGVILASGDITNAVGPNISTSSTTSFGTTSTDPELVSISTGTVNDAAILEFDFTPVSDTIKFRYVFSSEEYPEYVCSNFGDAFGFFLTGPNPAGGNYTNFNLATIPGSGGLPITINSVNPGVVGTFGTAGSCTSLAYASDYFDNTGGTTVEYDGFTIPLTAVAAVICGQSYHIKLAIADVSDHSYDSGVFLEGGSFTSPPLNISLASTAVVAGAPGVFDTVMYEGCSTATLRFQRTGTPCMMAYPSTSFYTITGTATNGVDYGLIGDSIYFPANTDTAFITITSLSDLLTEGVEYITLTMNSTTSPTTITLAILDAPPMFANLNNDTTFNCPPGPVVLTASPSGGITTQPYSYTWINASSTTYTATVSPITTTTYYCIVSDACGNSAIDSMTVTITSYIPMVLALTNDTSICPGDMVDLHANVTHGTPTYIYTWTGGTSTTSSMTVSPVLTTTYTVTVHDQCGQMITDHVTIAPQNLEAAFTSHNVTNQTIQFLNNSLNAVTSYWNFGDGSADATSIERNPQHFYPVDGTFTIMLVITNALGCTDTAYQTILVLPDVYFYFPNCFSPNGDGTNDFFSGYGRGIKDYHMQIFNRWGERVYDTDDMAKGWDGLYMGGPAEEGVYVCIFDLKTFIGNEMKKSGHVTLIR